VNPNNVFPEYPRPQMVRSSWINLNGPWDYAVRDSGAGTPGRYDGSILVPFPIESQLSRVSRAVTPGQRLWYHRSVTLPPGPSGTRWLLHFGAVDWDAVVTVDGRRVGHHRGGYDPFSFDITDALKAGAMHELVVSVWDPTDSGEQPRGKQVLRPGSIWYTAVTGIWQTVWLEPVPRTHIEDLSIVPDVDAGLARVTVTAPAAKGVPAPPVQVEAFDGSSRVASVSGGAGRPIVIPILHAHLWSPADPFLYRLRIVAAGDSVASYFGMRKIAVARDSAGTPRLFLNNQPLFEFGTLDQGWWPDGLYTAPTEDARRNDFLVLKDLGFNLMRKHVKVEPERWYYDADSLGVLLWQDMPSGDIDSDSGRAEYRVELQRILAALKNHPAIVMWVPFNEGWGQHDTRRTAEWVKRTDPSRLVNDASGWTDRGAGDVLDVHSYPGPEIPSVDSTRARVLGEFGGLGLPVNGHTWVTRDNWGYVRYPTPDSLWSGYQDLLSRVRALEAAGLAAAVYTQTTDVEVEVNGLMTYDRDVIKLPRGAREAADRLYAPLTGGGSVTKASDGEGRYTLTNASGIRVTVLTYGGIVQSIEVPDSHGRLGDVVLGFDSVADYAKQSPYFGAIVGRYANRIARGKFTLDGREYTLAVNNGPNALHGGLKGFDKVTWAAEPFQQGDSAGLTLTYVSPDGEEGYPGTLRVQVRYTLTGADELVVDYEATTDRATPINLSQHTYFNLSAGKATDILGHVLTLDAAQYSPVDSTLIPTGAAPPVAGTPFDFREPTAIGSRIGDLDAQLKIAGGYDHNFVLTSRTGVAHAARVVDPGSGRTLDVFTDQPGLQFYSGNFLDGTIRGKGGMVYAHRGGFCLETQHFPDSPNHPAFPSTILRPGQAYRTRTIFRFGVTG
jgi:galactose mutarotase-like enzyme